MSIGRNQILGGTKTYKDVSGYGITKTELNPEKNILLEIVQFTIHLISLRY